MNEIGKISIKISADTSLFLSDLKKLENSLKNKVSSINVSLSKNIFTDVKNLQNLLNKFEKVNIDVEIPSAVNKEIKSINNDLNKIAKTDYPIQLDTNKANQKIGETKTTINGINKNAIDLNVDNIKAIDKVDQVKNRIEILKARSSEISINPSVKESSLLSLQNQIGVAKNQLNQLSPSFLSSSFENLKGFGSTALNGITEAAKQARNALLGVGAVSAGLFALGIKSGLDYGGTMQLIRGDLEVVLNSSEKALKVLGEIKRFADVTPLESGDLLDATQIISQAVKGEEELILRTKQLGEVTGGIPAKLNRVANTYQQVVGKGKADTVDLKEFVNAGFTSIRTEAQKELGLTGEAFEKAVSDGALTTDVLNRVLDRVAEGFPRLKKASETLPGIFSTASETFKNFGLALVGIDDKTFELKTGGIAKSISNVLTLINTDEIRQNIQAIGDSIGSSIASLFDGIDFNAVVKNIFSKDTLKSISTSLKSLTDNIKSTAGIIINVINGIANSVGGFENLSKILGITAGTLAGVTIAVSLFSVALSPVTLTVLAISGAIAGLAAIIGKGDISKGLSEMAKFAESTFKALKSGFDNIVSVISKIDFGGIFKNLVSVFKPIANSFSQIFLGIVGIVYEAGKAIFGTVSRLVSGIVGAFNSISGKSAINGYLKTTIGIFSILFDVIKGLVGVLYTGYKAFLDFTQPLRDFVIDNFIKGLQNILNILAPLYQAFAETTKQIGYFLEFIGLREKGSTDAMIQGIDNLTNSTNSLADSTDDARRSQENQERSTEDLAKATEDLNKKYKDIGDTLDGLISLQISKAEADEDVAKSQIEYNETINKFGTNSKESTKAFNELTKAKVRQKDANNDLSKNQRQLIDETNAYLEKLKTEPQYIDKVSQASLLAKKQQVLDAIEVAQKNGQSTDSYQQILNKINEIEQYKLNPKSLNVNADQAYRSIDGVKYQLGTISDKSIQLTTWASQDQIISTVKSIISSAQYQANKNPIKINTILNSNLAFNGSTRFAKGGEVKKYANGGEILSFANGGIKNLVPKGDDTIAGYKYGEYVVNKNSTAKYKNLLNMLNYNLPTFDSLINSRVPSTTNSSTTNNNMPINVNVNVASNIQRGVENIGYLLKGEMLNRGLL